MLQGKMFMFRLGNALGHLSKDFPINNLSGLLFRLFELQFSFHILEVQSEFKPLLHAFLTDYY